MRRVAFIVLMVVAFVAASSAQNCRRPPTQNMLRRQLKEAHVSSTHGYPRMTRNQLRLKVVGGNNDCTHTDDEKRFAEVFRLQAQVSWFEQTLRVNMRRRGASKIYPDTLSHQKCCPMPNNRCTMSVGLGRPEGLNPSTIILKDTGACSNGRRVYEPVIVTDLSVGCHCAYPDRTRALSDTRQQMLSDDDEGEDDSMYDDEYLYDLEG